MVVLRVGQLAKFWRSPNLTTIGRNIDRRLELNQWRCLSSDVPPSSGSGDDGDNPNKSADGGDNSPPKGRRKGKQIPKFKGDPVQAKAKLDLLLQSIVKDQETRNGSKDQPEVKSANKRSEISFKLAKPITVKPPGPTEEEIKAAHEAKLTEKELGKEMLSAVKKVAAIVSSGDEKIVESELVKKLRSQSTSKINLSELVEGMKIDKTERQPPSVSQQMQDDDEQGHSRAYRVRRELGDSRERRGNGGQQRRGGGQEGRGRSEEEIAQLSYKRIDLFGGRPLGIFTKIDTPPTSYLKTWDVLRQKDVRLAAAHPPANGFEEMIVWTEQGKLWHFPINNEQGLVDEAKVSFADHVFLEPHISWCPKRGPIRHFMELVCIGLSRNPYMTVQEKKDHIGWYHEYFKNKSSIIKDVGAGDIQ